MSGASGHRGKALDALPNICNRCGDEGDLHVHHKDRDKSNGDLSNLEILCPSCHMSEHHGRGEYEQICISLPPDVWIAVEELQEETDADSRSAIVERLVTSSVNVDADPEGMIVSAPVNLSAATLEGIDHRIECGGCGSRSEVIKMMSTTTDHIEAETKGDDA